MFKSAINGITAVIGALGAWADTYRLMSKPEQSFPVLFSNTLPHPQKRPGVSADRRNGRGFRSLSVRSNRRKAKRKSQLIKRCSRT